MLFALLYASLRPVIGSGTPSPDRELEIEVIVLRHQRKVVISEGARMIRTRLGPPRPTRLLSGSFAPFATRSWISRSCSAEAPGPGYSGAMRSTTTPNAPHRGLDLRPPAGAPGRPISLDVPRVPRVDILGELIHEYGPMAD